MDIDIGIGKSGRRAWGFDDIAIVPSRRTRDPDDIDISWEIDAFTFALPMMAAAMDSAVSPATAVAIGRLGGLAVLNLEGLWTRYEDPTPCFEEIAALPGGDRHPAHAGDLRRAGQARADRAAHPGDEGGRRRHRRQPHPAAGARLRPPHGGGRPRRAGDPGHGGLGAARLVAHRAAEPEGVHRRVRPAGDRRGVRLLQHRPAPDAHRGGGGPGRGGPGGGLHHPRRARAWGCPRRRPSPTPPGPASATSTRPAATCTSSPTGGCAPAGTSPRPSPAAPTP